MWTTAVKFADTSVTTPSLHRADHHKTSTYLSSNLSRKSWTLLFSKSIKSRENLNDIGLIFKTNFQGISKADSESASLVALHIYVYDLTIKVAHLGSAEVINTRRKAQTFQRFDILLLVIVQKYPLREFPSFPLPISRFRNHSPHLFFLCPTELRSLLFGVTALHSLLGNSAPISAHS